MSFNHLFWCMEKRFVPLLSHDLSFSLAFLTNILKFQCKWSQKIEKHIQVGMGIQPWQLVAQYLQAYFELATRINFAGTRLSSQYDSSQHLIVV